jgi:hypothetical protein
MCKARPPEVAVRKCWLVVLGVAAAALAALAIWAMLLGPRFGPAYFHRLREGMTEQEVEAVLGCPAGDYRTTQPPRYHGTPHIDGFVREQAGRDCDPGEEMAVVRSGRRRCWTGDAYCLWVDLDENGRVVSRVLCERLPEDGPSRSWVGALADWLADRLAPPQTAPSRPILGTPPEDDRR